LVAAKTQFSAQLEEITTQHMLHLDHAQAMHSPNHVTQAFVDMGLGSESQVTLAFHLCDGDAEAALLLLLQSKEMGALDRDTSLSRSSRSKVQHEASQIAKLTTQSITRKFDEKMQQLLSLLEKVRVIESLIVLILQQCAVVSFPSSTTIMF
jgi:hypothetical protein